MIKFTVSEVNMILINVSEWLNISESYKLELITESIMGWSNCELKLLTEFIMNNWISVNDWNVNE
jgi:hypothetical protein